MHELVSLDYDSQTVSARELHEKLNIGTRFTTWFERMCEFGFNEGIEFFPKLGETSELGGRPPVDYDITIDMAKQICMIQRSPQGKAIRQHLIDLEKAWNTPEQVFARALKIADKTIASLNEKVSEMKPKALFADAVALSQTDILIGDLAKILKGNGVDIGQNRLFAWMRENGYLNSKQGDMYNMPSQKSMNMKLFKVKESTIVNPDGSVRVNKTTKVTGKGQQYFINKFLSKEQE